MNKVHLDFLLFAVISWRAWLISQRITQCFCTQHNQKKYVWGHLEMVSPHSLSSRVLSDSFTMLLATTAAPVCICSSSRGILNWVFMIFFFWVGIDLTLKDIQLTFCRHFLKKILLKDKWKMVPLFYNKSLGSSLEREREICTIVTAVIHVSVL